MMSTKTFDLPPGAVLDTPVGFLLNNNSISLVFKEKICVFNYEDAVIIFSYPIVLDNVQVWGIKGTLANLLTCTSHAHEFFSETS